MARARIAAVLAALVVALWAVFIIAGELLRDDQLIALAGIPRPPLALRVLATTSTAVPWAVAAVLLARGPSWAGTGTVLGATALTLPASVGLLEELPGLLEGPTGELGTVWWALAAGVALLPVALAAALLSWRAHPAGRAREAAPGVGGWYLTAAVLAWLGQVLAQTAIVAPGVPRRLVELPPFALEGAALTASTVLGAAGLAVVLWTAPRVRPALGSSLLLTVAGTALLALPYRGWAVVRDGAVIATPAGLLGVVGTLGLVATAMVWLRRGPQ